jgi:RNA polymerase sigma factor (sigma-70 family)
MAPEQPATVLGRSADIPGRGVTGESSDAQLLQLFAAQRDEAAFAALVHRHGPLVLSVCQRVLGSRHQGIEDAFQATFLVLIRKAGSVKQPELLGSWLYGVAYRIARKVRDSTILRQRHERQKAAQAATEVGPEVADDRLNPILDEELRRLPDKYRLPLVLCYLEGMTNEEAARRLRWPTGTVKGRLARARDLLRHRLVRRGVLMALGVVIGRLAQGTARAEVPAALHEGTVRAGMALAGVSPEGAAFLSPQALALAEAILRGYPRLRRVLLAVLLLLFAAGWTCALVYAYDQYSPWGSAGSGGCAHTSP